MTPRFLRRLPFNALIFAICIFIIAPIAVVLVASISKTPYLVFPPTGFTLKWYTDIVILDQYLDAIKFSFTVAILSTIISVALGLIVGLTLAATEFRGKAYLQAFFLSPIIVPELALALGLLQYFSQIGIVKGLMPLVLAHSVVCAPYAIRTIQAAAMRLDANMKDSALSLGARPYQVLKDITIPLVNSGLVAGSIMAFVISFDNVTISVFLAKPGATPIPALLFNQAAESGLSTTIAVISSILILMMLVVIILIEKFVGIQSLTSPSAANR